MTPEQALERIRKRMGAPEARWAYWQDRGGPMFVYNTEAIHSMYPVEATEGKYESVVYRPIGPGSRSGKARRWERDESTSFFHVLRRDAKDRAYRLYNEWKEAAR